LFFLYEVDPGIEPQFKAALRLLADEGLGSDRTVGKGLFQILADELGKPFPLTGAAASPGHWMTLSFFIPSEADVKSIDFRGSYYRLQHKRGWYNTYQWLSLKKKEIFGFSAGSVFKTGRTPTGTEVILLGKNEIPGGLKKAPAFDVLRSGFCYGIPVKVPPENDYAEVEHAR
jgi:CRISPR-associated protein Csm4